MRLYNLNYNGVAYDKTISPYKVIEKYPEILKHKPNMIDSYWFDYNDTESRINILKQAIEESKPKNKKI